MPKVKAPDVIEVQFTRQEVWDALRAKFPDVGMPEKCVDLGDVDEDPIKCCMGLRFGATLDSQNTIEEHEAIAVRFRSNRKRRP